MAHPVRILPADFLALVPVVDVQPSDGRGHGEEDQPVARGQSGPLAEPGGRYSGVFQGSSYARLWPGQLRPRCGGPLAIVNAHARVGHHLQVIARPALGSTR